MLKKIKVFPQAAIFFKLLPLYLMLTRIIKPMFNLILFGPPGSGKGTQSEKLISKYHLKHLSTGDLLRSEISNKTQLGLEAKRYMDKGSLVPDAVVIGMINDALDNNHDADGFLFDGFPRTAVQAEELDKLLSQKKTCIDVMLALKVSEEELVKRLIKRGETSGRSDDTNEQIIRARIEEYHKKTATVADHYQKENKVVMVKGEGGVDEIFDRLSKEIDRLKKLHNC
jgi:adenylate kinase